MPCLMKITIIAIIPSSQFLWWETEPATRARNQYASGMMMRTSQSHCHSGITQCTHAACITTNIEGRLDRSYCRSVILPTQSALERLVALLTPCYSSMLFLHPRTHQWGEVDVSWQQSHRMQTLAFDHLQIV